MLTSDRIEKWSTLTCCGKNWETKFTSGCEPLFWIFFMILTLSFSFAHWSPHFDQKSKNMLLYSFDRPGNDDAAIHVIKNQTFIFRLIKKICSFLRFKWRKTEKLLHSHQAKVFPSLVEFFLSFEIYCNKNTWSLPKRIFNFSDSRKDKRIKSSFNSILRNNFLKILLKTQRVHSNKSESPGDKKILKIFLT